MYKEMKRNLEGFIKYQYPQYMERIKKINEQSEFFRQYLHCELRDHYKKDDELFSSFLFYNSYIFRVVIK